MRSTFIRIHKRTSAQFCTQSSGLCVGFFPWHTARLLSTFFPVVAMLLTPFPTFTPLLKEIVAICCLIGRILLFVHQMSHSSVKCGLVFPHYLLIRSLPEISIFCFLHSDLQINICLPPSLPPPLEVFCSSDILRVRAVTDKLFCARRPVYLHPSVGERDEAKEQPWCYDAPYQTHLH